MKNTVAHPGKEQRTPFQIRFSDIVIGIDPSDAPVGLPPELSKLMITEPMTADAEYRIVLLEQPLPEDTAPVYQYSGTTVYRTPEGWLRIHPLCRGKDGCQVACLLRPSGKNILYYPAAHWDQYASPLHCAHLMGLETVLLNRNAFLLHSSVVMLEGKAVLFSGPSGAGKSTQARLWQEHLGAELLNGDRCVIMQRPDGFYGGGSPLAGSSNIYRPEQAPIAGIFLLEKGPENRVQRLGFTALAPLLSQTLINSWDTDFMDKLTTLYQQLLSTVPIYRLTCRPDADAVTLAYKTAFSPD